MYTLITNTVCKVHNFGVKFIKMISQLFFYYKCIITNLIKYNACLSIIILKNALLNPLILYFCCQVSIIIYISLHILQSYRDIAIAIPIINIYGYYYSY